MPPERTFSRERIAYSLLSVVSPWPAVAARAIASMGTTAKKSMRNHEKT